MSDTIESNGLEASPPKVSLLEYQRRYQRERKKGCSYFMIKPSTANKLKGYYNEYIQTCQQSLLPTVEFHDFVLQYAEIGWLNCRSKIKGK